MPVTPTYPGVYIEEIPSGVRSIAGVSTSVAAFLDAFKRGPANRAVRVFSFGDFEREFGGLDAASEASYAIQQFFLNGGTEAWVVRAVSNDAGASAVQISNAIGGGGVLTLAAASPGKWGDSLRARVDIKGTASGEFNLTLSEVQTVNGRAAVTRQEVFRNLSMTASKVNFAQKVINDALSGSKLAQVTAISGSNPPLSNGTLSGPHTTDPTLPATPTLTVTLQDGSVTPPSKDIGLSLTGAQKLDKIAPALESALRAAFPANPAFAGAAVSVVGNATDGLRLWITAGGSAAGHRLTFANAGPNTAAADLKLTAGATANAQEYAFGGGTVANTAQAAGAAGADGTLPGSAALIGDQTAKSGLYALEDVDLFNLLCIPRAASLDATSMQALTAAALAYCEKRRAFFLMDTPPGVDDLQEISSWLGGNATLRHRNAALYYPRVKVPDPLDDFRLRSAGASGTVAGVYARTDSARGVWKAPAGTEAATRNVPELEDVLTDAENGALNPLAINCLRNFPIYGNVVWGARTLEGSDQQASEWKYVPVRRLALYLEESLYRGLKWVVFEPNDEPLWAQIRLNVGAFMNTLFRQGAFQGMTPRDAYFVKCDKDTTTQADRNLGIVNIVVGFAPLKPAEFVILKLQQMAGQIQV